jgi:hypothetical protein
MNGFSICSSYFRLCVFCWYNFRKGFLFRTLWVRGCPWFSIGLLCIQEFRKNSGEYFVLFCESSFDHNIDVTELLWNSFPSPTLHKNLYISSNLILCFPCKGRMRVHIISVYSLHSIIIWNPCVCFMCTIQRHRLQHDCVLKLCWSSHVLACFEVHIEST